jgi:hypothetical protein
VRANEPRTWIRRGLDTLSTPSPPSVTILNTVANEPQKRAPHLGIDKGGPDPFHAQMIPYANLLNFKADKWQLLCL